ncbi:MAG: hypothetical protein JWL69_4167 [Phycisphaerales bacterium]|nr:hypothetical protein [Phycisphaerales bacterium]
MRKGSKLFAAVLSATAFSTGLVTGTVPAGAQNGPASAPASAPVVAGVQQMKIIVAEVKGLVQVRTAEDAPWQAAKAGMELDQGAEFRTGPRSSVVCQIPPDQTMVLDRLGTVKIAEAIRTGNKVKTDMIMKYGRTRYDIETAGAEHESTIRSPSSTLAVRGTDVSLYDQPPFTPVAESYHGRAVFRNAQRELRFGGKTFTKLAGDKPSPADTALTEAVVDPKDAQSRTRSEARYIADQTSKSAIFSFDTFADIPVIRNGPPPLTDSQLLAAAPSLPGTLDIVLRWQGNADINLVVGNQAGTDPIKLLSNFQPTEFLYPGFGLNHSKAGGTIPFDNRGGPNGGTEIAYWKGSNFPHGLYGISAVHESGGPALVSFNVFLNGKPLDNMTTFQVDSTGNLVTDPATGFPILIKNSQITRPLNAPSKPSAAFGPNAGVTSVLEFIPSVPALDDPVPVEPPVTFPPPASGKATKTAHAKATPAKTAAAAKTAIPAPLLIPSQPAPQLVKSPRGK